MSKLKLKVVMIAIMISVSGCSHYKSTWSCRDPKGIGCSSVRYADMVARKHIVLNEAAIKKSKKKVLVKEHYADFERYRTQLIEIE